MKNEKNLLNLMFFLLIIIVIHSAHLYLLNMLSCLLKFSDMIFLLSLFFFTVPSELNEL